VVTLLCNYIYFNVTLRLIFQNRVTFFITIAFSGPPSNFLPCYAHEHCTIRPLFGYFLFFIPARVYFCSGTYFTIIKDLAIIYFIYLRLYSVTEIQLWAECWTRYVRWWQNYTEGILATCANIHITYLQLQLSYLQHIHLSEKEKQLLHN